MPAEALSLDCSPGRVRECVPAEEQEEQQLLSPPSLFFVLFIWCVVWFCILTSLMGAYLWRVTTKGIGQV